MLVDYGLNSYPKYLIIEQNYIAKFYSLWSKK